MSLPDAFGIASSAFDAAGARMNVAASNLANIDSAGYRAGRVNLAEGPTGGVVVQWVTNDSTDAGVDENGESASNADPVRAEVDTMLAKEQYDGAALIVRATDEMLGTLLDICR
jgi:flagellar basal body rod protein FlgC